MATLPDSPQVDLSTRAARKRLPAQAKPYWTTIEPGLHLGYYCGARTATWYARRFMGDRKYRQVRLGRAEMEGQARNVVAFNYEAAVAKAREWHAAEGPTPSAPTPVSKVRAPASVEDSSRRLQPTRLDRISEAWAQERPDVDFWLPGFFLRIEYAHFKHDKRNAEVARAVGVNVPDLHVLLAMRRFGAANAMRPTDLFRELLITSGAITKRIDRLVAAKLIERVAASDDRRSGPVKLTSLGAKMADQAITRISESLVALVKASGLTDAELRQTDNSFRKLIAHM